VECKRERRGQGKSESKDEEWGKRKSTREAFRLLLGKLLRNKDLTADMKVQTRGGRRRRQSREQGQGHSENS
jgi:hypothetical protein